MSVPEKHRAIAHAWVDGARVEGRALKGTWPTPEEWTICWNPAWHEDWEYRIKPTRPTRPSIDWEHVASEYVALATDKDGNSFIYTRVPEATANTWTAACPCKSAEAFQSFVKGTCDWKDSLVIRPSAVSEKVAETGAPSPTTAHAPTPQIGMDKKWHSLNKNEDFIMYDWIKVADRLPEHGKQVVLITTESFWNTPDGVPEANVTATGYLSEHGGRNHWSIFGERGMELDAFTHWMPLQNPHVDT